jgi:hypothetical protein
MTTATGTLSEIAAFWRTARRLYTVYSELNRTFEIGLPLCNDLEYPVDRSEPEVLDRVEKWFEQLDAKVQVWQLRQLLQSTNLQTEENLRALVQRHLTKKQKTEEDRDKIDFLLVQYFAHCAPHAPYEQQLTLQEVAAVLDPVLGVRSEAFPDWTAGLDAKLQTLNQCDSLEELQKSGALVDVRELKTGLAEHYLEPPALIALTRFNFLARRAFFRAMHLDLHAIRNAIATLESRGIATLDCTEAGLTQNESLQHILHVVHQWKTPFRAPYSGGNSFLQLVALRHVLERALQSGGPGATPDAPQKSAAISMVSAPVTSAPKPHPEPASSSEKSGLKPKKEVPAELKIKPETPASTRKDAGVQLEEDGYLEQCIGDITRQLMAVPPKQGASVTPITLAGCKLLIATWEAEAFTKGTDDVSAALQRAVAARTILHVCVERHKRKEPTDLFVALELAHLAVEEMRQQVARAKEAKNIDGAVNLAATTKRLLALISEGEKLSK